MGMQFVNHKGVAGYPVRVPLGEMWMIRCQIVMGVRENFGVIHRPDTERDHRADQRQHSGRSERRPHAVRCPDLTRKRICDQPADVAQRELSGEQCWAIVLAG